MRADSRILPLNTDAWRKDASFDTAKLKTALPFAERARIIANLRLVQELHTCLNNTGWLAYDTLADGLSPLQLLHPRQIMLDVAPLDKAIQLQKDGDL